MCVCVVIPSALDASSHLLPHTRVHQLGPHRRMTNARYFFFCICLSTQLSPCGAYLRFHHVLTGLIRLEAVPSLRSYPFTRLSSYCNCPLWIGLFLGPCHRRSVDSSLLLSKQSESIDRCHVLSLSLVRSCESLGSWVGWRGPHGCYAAEVERDLAPLAKHAPQKFSDKLKTLVQLIGVFCRLLRSSIKVACAIHYCV